jgi:pyrimidine dimer DNA glycosylase
MRLWTIHPRYLDAKGLVALWREALLAQKILQNRTRGYKNHPQLVRFLAQRDPSQSIAAYLHAVCEEANSRGYRFDASKIVARRAGKKIAATRGQLLYEWAHLCSKLELRAPAKLAEIKQIPKLEAHPLFDIVPGKVEAWEKVA